MLPCCTFHSLPIKMQDGREMVSISIVVFQGCHNKWLHIEWTKMTEIYSFTVLVARSPKSRCQQTYVSSEASGKNSSLPLPWREELLWLLAPLAVPWLVNISFQYLLPLLYSLLWVSRSLCVLSSSYKDTNQCIEDPS